MRASAVAAIGLALLAAPLAAQDEGSGEIIVTGMRVAASPVTITTAPPVIGLRRLADSAVRNIEITSDSRDAAMRQREVQAMLLAAIDRAGRQGFSLVTGQLEVVEVTRANWQDQFPGLAGKDEPDDDDDEDDGDNKPKPAFEDYSGTTTIRLKVKTKLDGSIGGAQAKIAGFVKSVPPTGRSQIVQKGGIALTIIKPEQYRDELYARIAAGAKQAASFYPTAGVEVTGLDEAVAWTQVSNTELFVYIPYGFVVKK
ncbi:hypothetical protein [Glacieibacterium frigidum]|uniref:TonB-dependent receptor n=1 Tax=Glacieibacterium frigidum TaxID=2593303 RepID=A0A552UAD9_9SPHN|nr:hypothetical protein [Glacieibacterium frigidum]TRW15178.1 hypothetical protein FMM06_16200 [Glacieibacterium frigidum]